MKFKYGENALYNAATLGDINFMEKLLENGYELGIENENGTTALQLSINHQHLESIRLLIRHGSVLNFDKIKLPEYLNSNLVNMLNEFKDENGDFLVHFAAKTQNLKLIEQLTNVQLKNREGSTPFHIAAKTGNFECLSSLLTKGSNADELNQFGQTPLHVAARHENANCISILIKYFDINAKDKNGQTALHLAAKCGNVEILITLLKSGACLHVKDMDGKNPLHHVAEFGHVKCLKIILSDPTYLGNEKKNQDLSNLLDESKKQKITPSGRKKYRNILPFTKIQLKAKQSKPMDAVNEEGQDLSNTNKDVPYSDEENFKLISIDEKEKDHKTALHLASENGHLDVVQLLLYKGASVDAKDINEMTPLHLSSKNAHLDVVQLLLDERASVDAKDINEMTPLQLASQHGNISVVLLLLEEGASTDEAEKKFQRVKVHKRRTLF